MLNQSYVLLMISKTKKSREHQSLIHDKNSITNECKKLEICLSLFN